MKLVQRTRQLRRTLKNAGRLKVILGVFARHGFGDLIQRVRLGRYLAKKFTAKNAESPQKLSVAVRIRKSFEELGPTFVKFGQVLSTRTDLIPDHVAMELAKLQDRVSPLPFDQIELVLASEGLALDEWTIDPKEIGSASIAQVYRARSNDGSSFVLKVQKPGIIEIIEEDLSVIYFLTELLETNLPDFKKYRLTQVVHEFFQSLELETNFVAEANNLRRFRQNFENETDIYIPNVDLERSTERVLLLEDLKGAVLSELTSDDFAKLDRAKIIEDLLKAFLKMVFVDGFFHADLHPGNCFLLENGKIGLIDFGSVGRLNVKAQHAIAQMLLSLSEEDYDGLAYEYALLSPIKENLNFDLFARQLRDMVAPLYGMQSSKVNLGKMLMKSANVAARHDLSLPSELLLFFKSLIAMEGLVRRIDPQYDFLTFSVNYAKTLVLGQSDPGQMLKGLRQTMRESSDLVASLPRQLHFFLRKMNSPNARTRLEIQDLDLLRLAVLKAGSLIFWGLVISALLLSLAIYLRS